MRKFGLLGSSAICTAALGFSMAFAAPALAQTTTGAQEEGVTEAEDPAELGQNETELESGQDAPEAQDQASIVVTGSRINRPNLTAPVPITSVGVQDLTSTGNVSLGDALNELPSLRATFSQSNSTRFIGTAGLNLLDLRGLGSARTLVLVNGRRHVTSQPGSFGVDVNTIPTDLLERVDVVTGGNSAIYGSDAVAGVVNFVLKRDFDGIRIRAQSGISSRGDRPSYFVSGTAGRNFADGRGNVAVALEYAKSEALYFTDREDQYGAFSGRRQFNAVEFTGVSVNPTFGLRPAESASGNGIPDQAFLIGVRNNNISSGGLFAPSCPTTPFDPDGANGPLPPESQQSFNQRRTFNCTGVTNPGSAAANAQFARTFVFTPQGSLIPNPCATDLRPASTNCIGGLGSTLLEVGQLQPELERYAANLIGHFEISPAFRPFIEAKYVRVNSVQEGQATFFLNTFSIDNPFLTPQARATILAASNPGTTSFSAQRFNTDFAGRGEDHRRETYRVVVGVDGTFNDDWRYEVALNYGRLETFYETRGNVNLANYARAINAVSSGGQIVCAVNADANPNNNDPACVPLNLFGERAPSAAALAYISATSTREQKAQQYNATAFVSGDLSQLFELPGGPIGFAVGAEYRRETAFSAFDAFTQTGGTFLNSSAPFDPPALEVKEVFGEVRIPLLAEMPFFEELELSAAGRYSDYSGATGGVFAYNFSAIWSPVRDIRFRAGYAKSVRAPTLSDQFTADSQTFVNAFADPCSQNNINNNPNRKANCAAAGVPTTQTFPVNGVLVTEPFTNASASGISGFNRGNPDVSEERGTSLTLGFVAQPRWIPGLSISLDYYDIKLKDAIFSLGGQTVINQCYDNPGGIDNPFCSAVFRNANGTFQGQSSVIQATTTVPLTVTGPSFFSQPFNFARLETSGLDLDVAYRRNIANNITLNLRGIVSWVEKRNFFTDVTNPDFADRAKSELGDPAWRGSFNAGLDFGMFDVRYNLRWIGKQTVGAYETQNSFQGRPPQNPDQFPFVYYDDVFYHDLRLGFEPEGEFKFYIGVDNLLDRAPPFGIDATGAGGGIFENVGRFFYAGAEIKF